MAGVSAQARSKAVLELADELAAQSKDHRVVAKVLERMRQRERRVAYGIAAATGMDITTLAYRAEEPLPWVRKDALP